MVSKTKMPLQVKKHNKANNASNQTSGLKKYCPETDNFKGKPLPLPAFKAVA